MKYIATLFLLLSFMQTSWAQERRGEERIKAFKTGYITQEMDLSSEEAEKFWPIYNEFEKRLFELRVSQRKTDREKLNSLGGLDALTEKEAEQFLHDRFETDEEMLRTKKELYTQLKKVLPSVKLLKLYKAEMDFNKRLLSEFRRRGPMNHNK